MAKELTRMGRPFLFGSVGNVCVCEVWGVPDDAGVVDIPVPSFDVADGVALCREGGVVVVGVEVRGDSAIVEVGHV